MRTLRKGHIAPIAFVFMLITMGFSLAFLRWVVYEKVAVQRQYAYEQAYLAAETGIWSEGQQMARAQRDSISGGFPIFDINGKQLGFCKAVTCSLTNNDTSHKDEYVVKCVGVSSYRTFLGDEVRVERTAYMRLVPNDFSIYMYFTQDERSGGGPFSGDSPVYFGANDILYGRVHSNSSINMSSYGCPTFYGTVTTSGVFNMGSCNENQVFPPGTVFEDSAEVIQYPPTNALQNVLSHASLVLDAGSKLSSNPNIPDTLIMTLIEFVAEGGFYVTMWPYVVPPRQGEPDSLAYYHSPKFHHFDFPRPQHNSGYVMPRTYYSIREGVIYVKDGQVQVKGIINGRYTVVTDEYTRYRRHSDPRIIDVIYNNIWIIDDLVYVDSDRETGQTMPGSLNRLGLVSGANVIIANTRANGGRNQTFGSDVIINAAILAMNESFCAHYWQNSTTYYYPPYGDGKGPYKWGFNSTTGGSDMRGYVHLWGSIAQKKRGYMRRNTPGPYAVYPGIGYYKDYHYDKNFLDFPPPYFPDTVTSDGRTTMRMVAYGEWK